jgi:hypothetical protein
MNHIKNLLKIFSLVAVIALALALAGARGTSWAQADDDDRQTVSIPLGSTGLVSGEGIRTTLTNLGVRRIRAQTSVIDADGAVLKQESFAIEPNQAVRFEMSRSEVLSDERSVMLMSEVSARLVDARSLWMTSEVIEWATGSTRFQIVNRPCPTFYCGSGNHNETMVRDTAPAIP